MNASVIDTSLCPACGASNRCTLADPRTADQACWCFSVSIDAAKIRALPEDVRSKACLCPRCAGIESADTGKTTG
jgi:hypothetical protein